MLEVVLEAGDCARAAAAATLRALRLLFELFCGAETSWGATGELPAFTEPWTLTAFLFLGLALGLDLDCVELALDVALFEADTDRFLLLRFLEAVEGVFETATGLTASTSSSAAGSGEWALLITTISSSEKVVGERGTPA